jgi:hypothetical protein
MNQTPNVDIQDNNFACVCGIYGYWFTQCFSVENLTFIPRFSDYTQMKNARVESRGSYVLSGLVATNSPDNNFQHNLAAVLTVLQQRDVLVTEGKTLSGRDPRDAFDDFHQDLGLIGTSNELGSVLLDDVFAEDSNRVVISSLLGRLNDSEFCERTKYSQLIFKVAERYRQRDNYLEINYFLLFSGLEAYSKACQQTPRTERDVAVPIAAQLSALGFNVSEENTSEPIRAVRTYSTLRNALFHEAELNGQASGSPVTMADFYVPFCTLVLFVTLRAADVSEGHLNWDGWVTKQWH